MIVCVVSMMVFAFESVNAFADCTFTDDEGNIREATCFENATVTKEGNVFDYNGNKIKISTIIEEVDSSHDALGFVEHHEAVPPTCESDGVFEYWYCTKCEKYFVEEELQDATKIKVETDKNGIVDKSIWLY